MTTCDPPAPAARADLTAVMAERHSCRAFLPGPLPRSTITAILRAAGTTASWCNTQPWHVTVLSGGARDALAALLTEHAASGAPQDYDLGHPEYVGVSRDRRRACGWALYEAVGVVRGDREGALRQAMENFRFFGAPHVAVITCDRALGTYGVLDCGGYVSSFLTAAAALGVAAIAQAAVVGHAGVLRAHLGIPDDRVLVCAVAFGTQDPGHRANSFRTERAPIEETVTFLD